MFARFRTPATTTTTLLLFLWLVLLVAIVTESVEAKRPRKPEEIEAERILWDRGRQVLPPDDPNFRVGQWGRYGRISHGPDWLHREMRTQAERRGRPVTTSTPDPEVVREQPEQPQPEEGNGGHSGPPPRPPRPKKPEYPPPPSPWTIPSPLTNAGVAPVAVHVPMTDAERAQYERGLEQQAVRRQFSVSGLGESAPDERDVAVGQHPLPASYLDRVRGLADRAGFDYAGLAAPTVMPEHHLLHAKPQRVADLLTTTTTEQTGDNEGTQAGQGGGAVGELLPPALPSGQWEDSSDPAQWHAEATRQTREMAERGEANPGVWESPQAWQARFEGAMRRQSHTSRSLREWRDSWREWAKQAAKHPQRAAMAATLQRALMEESEGQVLSAEPQHPQPRVLKGVAARGVGRQPGMWQAYRERWDAPEGDERPARDLDGDPRHRSVSDPMLTEQWSVYDAAAWGDLPPGPHTHRPSLSAGPPIWDVLGFDGTGVVVGVVDSGIELGHPELVRRYTRATSYDALNPTRNRPPTPVDPWVETHGTQAAGVAVAERGNGICGAGVAPGARLGAVRLLGIAGLRSPTDAEEAAAISHACRPHGSRPSHNVLINSLYSCSWGPVDDGADLRGPGRLAAAAMAACVHRVGRHHKGSIYVWAGGNGRTYGDNVNFDGYANRPETVAVGAIDDMATQAWYSEPGACLLVSAPSSGGSSGIVSSDPSGPAGLSTGRCTRSFGGTSAAAPAVAGVVALMLQAAPDLRWRDVQHILVHSAQPIALGDRREPWTRTADETLMHSHGYGFGLLNATTAVLLSSRWRPIDPKEALAYSTPILQGQDTWDRNHAQAQRQVPQPDAGTHDRAGGVDTTGYHDPGAPYAHGSAEKEQEARAEEKEQGEERVDGEPLAGEEEKEKSPEELNAEQNAEDLKKVVFFGTRYIAKKAVDVVKTMQAVSEEARLVREEAQRELQPNRVRILAHHGGVAVPPGFSAHFEWEWPAPWPNMGKDDDPEIVSLEHVALRLEARTPADRGMLRIWLCSPSGTCSLMAPAPRENDKHKAVSGQGWQFWTVRHWNERPRYDEDRTGHGPGTWSLRLTHTWPVDEHRAHRLRDLRVRHPEQVDVVVRWWQLEFRGTAEHPPTGL